jgi:hypothetical protein
VRHLETDGVSLQDHQTKGVGMDGTIGMHKSEVSDFHEAHGQDMLEEPAAKLDRVETGGTWPCTSRFAGGEGDGAVLKAHDTTVGDGDLADIWGEVFAGGVAVCVGLAVDVPGDVPELGIDLTEKSGLGHFLLADGSVDRREGLDGDKDGGSGREPLGAVLGESTGWGAVMDMGMVLELSAPGMEEAGKTGQGGADEALILGETFESRGRRLEQS